MRVARRAASDQPVMGDEWAPPPIIVKTSRVSCVCASTGRRVMQRNTADTRLIRPFKSIRLKI